MNRSSSLAVAWLLCTLNLFAAENVISLAGDWRFRLDRLDAGERERWFAQSLPDRVRLPGGLAEQGIGDPPSLETPWIGRIQNPEWFKAPEFARYATADNFKFPYWLTPERHYVGAAWFEREIDIPAGWADRRVVLGLERTHWETRVWIDENFRGASNALATPHEYDLGALAPGRHRLAIRVDNRLVVDVGVNSHSVSDHTQGNWLGIVGRIELRATPRIWIEDLQLFPDRRAKSVRVHGRVGNVTGQRATAKLQLRLHPASGSAVLGSADVTTDCPAGGGDFTATVNCRTEIEAWDEFNPRRYALTAQLGESREADRRRVEFGFRDLAIDGTQFVLNGRKTFFRGTLECAIFPRTGHPPTDVESWRKVMRAAKAHGLNMLRFHSWCPPEAAFAAADELGMYLHVECSSWANQSTSLGDGKPIDAWIYAEADRILRHYGNHPSFVLLLYGNEPGGKGRNAYLARWVGHYRARDPRRLYSSGAGWPELAENECHVIAEPRIQAWGGGLKSRINARPPETTTDYRGSIAKRTVPVISHEIGQWCVYPNFAEIPKYTGYLKARNFEIFRDQLAAHQMAGQAHAFLLASGKLQTLCYKEDIESALRTPGMGGFQLLDLHDFPGQGTALVGVLDPFWEEKGYVTPAAFRRFCNATVPLARLAKRVFTADEKLEAALEIAHFGPAPLARAEMQWRLVDDRGRSVAQGSLPRADVPIGNGTAIGRVQVDLRSIPAPARYRLVAGVRGTPFENDWDVWVYPSKLDTTAEPGIRMAGELDPAAVAALARGERVLLLVPPARVRNAERDPVVLGFSSIFWNTAWTKRQPPTTLGILCDPKHPALAGFPTDSHSNWQWWYVIHRARAMILDDLPPELRPTIQVIDDWFTARRLGLAFEARVGGGRLLVCSVDLQSEPEADPVRRQLRDSLLRYMRSEKFQPRVEVSVDKVRGLMRSVP